MSNQNEINRAFTQYLADEVLHPAASEALQVMIRSDGLERTLTSMTPRDVSFKAVHDDDGSMFVARCFGQELYLVPGEQGVDVVVQDRSGHIEAVGSVLLSEPTERLEAIVRAFVESSYKDAGVTDWACARGFHRAIL